MNNLPNIWCSILVAERWFSIRTVFQCCLLIEELQWWLPVRDQSFALCCPTPSSVRRTVGVCESFPEDCAIFLCIEVHLDWVVLFLVRLVSTETVRHPCVLKSLPPCSLSDVGNMSCGNVVLQCKISLTRSTLANSVWWHGGLGAAEDLWFLRCLVSIEHTQSGVVTVVFLGLFWIAIVFRPFLGQRHGYVQTFDLRSVVLRCHCEVVLWRGIVSFVSFSARRTAVRLNMSRAWRAHPMQPIAQLLVWRLCRTFPRIGCRLSTCFGCVSFSRSCQRDVHVHEREHCVRV